MAKITYETPAGVREFEADDENRIYYESTEGHWVIEAESGGSLYIPRERVYQVNINEST